MLNRAVLYLKGNFQAQRDAVYVLEKYFKFLAPVENGTVLDIGCGPGNVTAKTLFPLLPKSTKKVIGIDISDEIISYARTHFLADPRLRFRKMDIVTDDIPLEYAEAFDYIFSLYCLHFVADKRKAIENIYKMSKPGGDILLSFMSKSAFFDAYNVLYEREKWKPYMTLLSKVHGRKELSKKLFETVLTDVGFKVHNCVFEDRSIPYSVKEFIERTVAVSPFNMPVEKEQEFALDLMEYLKQHHLPNFYFNENGEEMFNFCYTLAICHARKQSY